PPMASTAMGSTSASGARLLDVDGLAAAVPPAVRAHDVRQLHVAALRADAARRCRQLPVGGAAAAALGLRGLLLGDGHRGLWSLSGSLALWLSVSSRWCAARRAPPISGRWGRWRARSRLRCGWPRIRD